jgi:transcriptional regulator of acetoin/glycerol metabolism
VDNAKSKSIAYQIDTHRTININNIKSEDYKSLHSSEKDIIIQALEENKGIINFAAKALGISRTTLWRKMKKYDLDVSW